MTNTEIVNALADIVLKKESECKAKIAALPKESVLEKKALMIEMGMYSLCLRAGLLYNTLGTIDNAVKVKCNRMPRFVKHFPKLAEYWNCADDEEKLKLTAALYGEVWMYDQFVIQYQKEYDTAVAENDAQKIFETRIKLGVVKQVLLYWNVWRIQNGLYRGILEEVI